MDIGADAAEVLDGQKHLNRLTDRRMRLGREYDSLLHGHSSSDRVHDSANGVPAVELREAASAGPIAIINASKLRCDAVLVQASGLETVPLSAKYETAAEVAERYVDSLTESEECLRTASQHRRSAATGGLQERLQYVQAIERLQRARGSMELVLLETLEWLWLEVTEPVLRRLGFNEAMAPGVTLPRLWWCPTGPFTVLPLHAAGRSEGRLDSVLDRVVSSYTPTVSALLRARRAQQAASASTVDHECRVLLVSLPQTPGELPLPHVEAEAEAVSLRMPSSRVTVLEQERATRDAVLSELATHCWAHFGCHAEQDMHDPSSGGLLLHDGKISILDLARIRPEGDLAFLSACKTATGGIALAEESVTIAAAFHYAGYRRVIATLWSVHDQLAADVADVVYRSLISEARPDATRSAVALHAAVLRLREAHGDQPSLWSPYIHIGL